VIDTIVLLNVAEMWATPVWMFFRTFFFCLPLTVDMVPFHRDETEAMRATACLFLAISW
jgi:hypothetical protein